MMRVFASTAIAAIIPYLLVVFTKWDWLWPPEVDPASRFFYGISVIGIWVAAYTYPGWQE